MKYTKGGEADGKKKYAYYGESTSTNFPESPHRMRFVAFSCATGNCWDTHAIPIYLMRFANFFLCFKIIHV